VIGIVDAIGEMSTLEASARGRRRLVRRGHFFFFFFFFFFFMRLLTANAARQCVV